MLTLRDIPAGSPIRVSATLFVTYLTCPQQALERLRGTYPVPSRASFKGALSHRIFARHLMVGPIGVDEFDQACREETGANLNGQLTAVGLRPSDYRRVVAEVGELYETFKALPTNEFVDAEVSVNHDASEDLTIVGRIDAVFQSGGGLRIVDWKTGAYLESATPQLAFYAFAWKLATGVAPSHTEALSLSTGEAIRDSPSDEDIARTENEVAHMVIALRSAMDDDNDLVRNAGPYCRWCPIVDDCAEGQSALAVLE